MSPLLLPPVVTLSGSEGSVALGSEMLRCAQHDRDVRDTLINAILTARKTTCEEVNKNAL